MSQSKDDAIRQAVREAYARVANSGGTAAALNDSSSCSSEPAASAASSCCGGEASEPIATPQNSCCSTEIGAEQISAVLGYSKEEMGSVPDGANMGLGCGNPQAIASLVEGETVVDLGSGAGFDCFLAANEVGKTGKVIGVDMTPDMISKARGNAEKGGYSQVEFRLGEIEHLPVEDGAADVIISNCVINLSPNKDMVFKDAFRILKKGGRLAISDVVATADLPEDVRADLALYSACMSGAALVSDIEGMLAAAGFSDIKIRPKDESREFIRDWAVGSGLEDLVVSATIEAVKA